MNLSALFEKQRELDNHIIAEKGLEGKDLLSEKILSLQVELGELANELPEVFKFWSNKKNDYEKALVEYCDVLHFLLSVGNELEYDYVPKPDFFPTDLVTLFLQVNAEISDIYHFLYVVEFERDQETLLNTYQCLFDLFLMIGQRLGFTEQEAMDAYIAKNKINHARQDNSY